MHLKVALLKLLKLIAADTRSAIVSLVVGCLILAGGGILALSKTALSHTIHILSIPTPLWVTILLILLCCAYIYLKPAKIQSKPTRGLSLPPPIIKYFSVDLLKWKTKIYRDDYFEVDETPICIKHDLPLIYYDNYYQCPEADKRNCKILLNRNERYKIYETAKSYIEKRVRNHDY
jgi:hypothetical protein